MHLKFKIILSFLLLPICALALNGDAEYKRSIIKEFKANGSSSVEVLNKYGNVIIHTWDKEEVKATIVITGFGRDESEARAIAESVNIIAEGTGRSVIFQTKYDPSSSKGWFSWGSKRDSKDYVNINYDIYLPRQLARLLIDNSFGNVVTDRLTFPTEMKLNYCFYDIKESTTSLELSLNYCQKGKVGKANSINLSANYSGLRSEEINVLDAKSNYSEYHLGSVGTFNTRSNYDEYSITKIGNVNSRSNYSSFRLGELQKSADVKLNYGDFKIKRTADMLISADFQITYADLTMSINTTANLQIDVKLTHGDLDTDGINFKNVTTERQKSDLKFNASTGGSGRAGNIIVRGTHSNVEFRNTP